MLSLASVTSTIIVTLATTSTTPFDRLMTQMTPPNSVTNGTHDVSEETWRAMYLQSQALLASAHELWRQERHALESEIAQLRAELNDARTRLKQQEDAEMPDDEAERQA